MKGFFVTIALLVFLTPVFAEKTEYWVASVGKGVYQRCEGQDLHINQPYLKLANNSTITKIAWPYPQTVVTKVIDALVSGEPYDNYLQGCQKQEAGGFLRNRTGCSVLTCANNTMDIVWTTYYWNGEVIDQSAAPPATNTTPSDTTNNSNTAQLGTTERTERQVLVATIVVAAAVVVGVIYSATSRNKKATSRRRRK